MQVETPERVLDEAPPNVTARVRIRPLLLFLSIVAILSSSLEIEVLEHLDYLSSYMRYREIALDAGVALLLIIVAGLCWWAIVWLLTSTLRRSPFPDRYGPTLAWRLGLAVPLTYFATDLVNAIVRVRLGYHPQPRVWAMVVAGIVVGCLAALWAASVIGVQRFCRQKIVPLGWLHLALAVIACAVLIGQHVYLFHDYIHPSKVIASNAGGTAALPDVYLITFDALRADDMSLYGYARPTTPNLDRFSRQSTTFDYFFANSNFTTTATTSIETGELPWRHRVFQGGGFLQADNRRETLAAVLRRRGYYTAMITANFFAAPFRHRTLESYDAVEHVSEQNVTGAWISYTNLIGTNAQHTLTVPLLESVTGVRRYLDALVLPSSYPASPERVFQLSRELLEQRPKGGQPLFLWTHVLAPHDPYLPAPPFRQRFLAGNKLASTLDYINLNTRSAPKGISSSELQARYDEMILQADKAFGDFIDWLDQTGRMKNAIVIVSADHGEAFEHGWFTHTGPYLYNDLIHVPLLIHLPGQRNSFRSTQPAQQADLLPTVADLVSAPAANWTDGTSLKQILDGRKLPERYVFSMNLEPNSSFEPIRRGTVAVMDEQFKYIKYLGLGKEELFQYRTDPAEVHDLIGSAPEVAQRMRAALDHQLQNANQQFTPSR